jgi:hypothetical protein
MILKGTSIPPKRKAHSLISRVKPVKPPGISPPAWTKVLMLKAISKAPAVIKRSRFIVLHIEEVVIVFIVFLMLVII